MIGGFGRSGRKVSKRMNPYFDNGVVQLYQADAREIPLPDQSVHCVVTSPPYFGLRVYADNDERGIGLESSVEEWLTNIVDVFREVRRVLRDDGVCWVNLGDSRLDNPFLLGIPERVVLALQADGWIWRDTVIWAKESPMPESLNGWRWERCRVKVGRDSADWSIRPKGWQADEGAHDIIPDGNYRQNGEPDATVAIYEDCPGCPKCEANDGLVLRKGSWRCTSSHEYIFMLVKSMGYYCDAEAVKTAAQYGYRDVGFRGGGGGYVNNQGRDGDIRQRAGTVGGEYGGTANRRSVWNDISPEPYGGSHFATFPSDLPRICIQASTSEAGVCAECGSQWARVVDTSFIPQTDVSLERGIKDPAGVDSSSGWGGIPRGSMESKTLGWRPTCGHDAPAVPAMVLDPFAGTDTTGLAAQKLGRHAVGVDISEDYLKQAVKRLSAVTLPLGAG